MNRFAWSRGLLVLAAVALVAPAIAEPSHRPVAVGSLEVNGAPQPMKAHHGHRGPPPAALAEPAAQSPLARSPRVYSGAPIDVLTYHNDNSRTGWNRREADLTAASVASSSFGKIATLNVDGNVFAQPLLVSGYTLPSGAVHDVLIVATGHNSVYAFDAKTYAQLWKVNLGTAQATNDVGCGDVNPEYGISSTPVIVRSGPSAATLYVVAATEPASFSFHTQLHALDVGTGADLLPAVEIAPSAQLSGGQTVGFDPQNQWSRAGLAFAGGAIYVSLGSHCDNNAGSISGWLLRYDNKLNLRHAFNTIETSAGYELASIWMTGFAPAADSKSNLFVVTGNGAFHTGVGAQNYGESVLSLSRTLLAVNSTFTPAAWQSLNDGDVDFGSGGIMLLPTISGQTAPPLAVTMGKDATLYLLNRSSLGGLQSGDAGALQSIRLAGSGGGIWGGPAYFVSRGHGMVYVQIDSDVLRSFQVSVGATPGLTPAAVGTSHAGYGGSLPIVSSNNERDGTGVVWLVRRGATEQLEAYDAAALGAPLFAANAGVWSSPGNGNSFVTPMEANGRVYVPAYKTVTVFGLTQ